MRYTYLAFPDFKKKALTFSYDDGMVFDYKLLDIFNKYGLKGTFNLSSGLLDQPNRVKLGELKQIYLDKGHEVAIHGEYHHTLTCDSNEMVVQEIIADRKAFEKELGVLVTGMAYANGVYDDRIIDVLKACGVTYARTTVASDSIMINDDFLRLQPTCHHKSPKLNELIDLFLDPKEAPYYWSNFPKLLFVWGHSYEYEYANNWELLEDIAKKLSFNDNVWYATNGEIVNYLLAFRQLKFSVDGRLVYNPTATDLYLINNSNQQVFAPAGKTVNFNKK